MTTSDTFDFGRYDPKNLPRRGRSGGDAQAAAGKPLGKLFDREAPYSAEAEISLLGSMILDPNVIGDVMMIVRRPEDFYIQEHGWIFRALIEVFDRHHSGDLVQTQERLRQMGVYEQVGGEAKLLELAEAVPAAVNAPFYARIVADKAKLRRLIDAAGKILYDAYHVGSDLGPEGVREVIDVAETKVFEIAEDESVSEPQELKKLLQDEIDRLEAQDGKGFSGVPTGYTELDDMLRGLQPGELVIIAARPSMGKCLAHDAEIVLEDGSIATLADIVARKSASLFTLQADWKLGTTTPSDYIDDGFKPVFEVTTRLGRKVRTTLTHPFLTVDGWKPLGELCVGDHVAVPRRIPVEPRGTMRDCEIKLLAYLIGDGGLTGTNPRFTNSNPAIAEDFANAAKDFGSLRLSLSSTRSWEAPSWRVARDVENLDEARAAFGHRLRAAATAANATGRSLAIALNVSPGSISHWMNGATVPDADIFRRLCVELKVDADDLAPGGLERIRRNDPNPLTKWLTDLGLNGHGASTKFIPAPVFTLKLDLLAVFLNRLFATDGWAAVLASGQPQIGYSTTSERLSRQIQHLLLRFGVVASLRHRWVKYKDSRRSAWQLDITDWHSLRTFVERIGIFGKQDAVSRVAQALDSRSPRTNTDLIPLQLWNRIAARKGDRTWRSVAEQIGATGDSLHVGKRALSRNRLAAIAKALEDDDLAHLAASDVYWDPIVSIEPVGMQQVYDLTIPTTHNFVANDVCVHNTALALNLAEQIALGGLQFVREDVPRVPIGFFSLEMSKSAVTQRLISARSGISSHNLRSGHGVDFRRVIQACGELEQAPIFVDDTPNMTVMTLRARARRLVRQHGIKCIMIDYLQLLTSPGAARESRQVEVSTISRGIKALARELDLPVVCLAQLNRASEQREGNRPRMADLRESGSIEQDADVIILLHREDYYHVQDENWGIENPDKIGVAELIIAKQRNGPTGVVKLKWDAATTRFKNLDEHAQAPMDIDRYVDRPAAAPSPPRTYAPPPDANEPPPFDTGRSGGFAAGRRTGPVDGHRDGGGPDRDEGLDDLPV